MKTLFVIDNYDTPIVDHNFDDGDLFTNPDSDAYYVFIQPQNIDSTVNELKEIVPSFSTNGDEGTAIFERTFQDINSDLFSEGSLERAIEANS